MKEKIIIENALFSLELQASNGNVLSYKNKKTKTEYISHYGTEEALIVLRLMDESGARQDVRSDFQCEMTCYKKEDGYELSYRNMGGLPIDAQVYISYDESSMVRWSLKLHNKTGMSVEWTQFPNMLLLNRTENYGGNFKVFLPLFEGVEISDYTLREKHFGYFLPDYPSKGWEGMYPGPVSLQFMALYDGEEGLYLGMHDDTLQSKGIDMKCEWNGFIPSLRFLPGVEDEIIATPFETVTGFFEGDFYNAASIYRDFVEGSRLKVKRKESPSWLNNPPIVVIYPIRGQKDTGDVSPNCYYPYTNAIPYLQKLKEALADKIMVMLCHWEGSAPWCPPYNWPPYGDLDSYNELVSWTHENGDLFGLYCSGISWTENSVYTDFNAEGRLTKEELCQTMCIAPNGELPYAIICNEWLRNGYDMCPYTQGTRKIMRTACEEMFLQSGADYIQLFDQNLGGNSSLCYSKEHGHPRTPGKWQTLAMRSLIEDLQTEKQVLGCESAASEGFNDLLPFNDGRNYMGFCIGTPVPAYAFVYHESILNFMGNQNTVSAYLDVERNPHNLLYRLGHLFAQGDSLCLVLKENGKINWDWGTPWDCVDPDQENVFRLLRCLITWKNGSLHEELLKGRMEIPFKTSCDKYKVERKDGKVMSYPAVITRAWKTKTCRSQIFVNPLPYPQRVSFAKIKGKLVKEGNGRSTAYEGDGFILPPFSVHKLILD